MHRYTRNVRRTAHYCGGKFKFENECSFRKQNNFLLSSVPTSRFATSPIFSILRPIGLPYRTYCVICKVRNHCHRWFNITHNVLHCNNSLIPDWPQQCHHKALFGFSIVHFHRNLIGRNSGHIPLQI